MYMKRWRFVTVWLQKVNDPFNLLPSLGGGVIVKSTVDDLHIVVFVAVAVIINKNIKVMHTLLNVLICDYHLVVLICLYGQAELHIKGTLHTVHKFFFIKFSVIYCCRIIQNSSSTEAYVFAFNSRHLQHESMPLFLLTSCFTTLLLRHVQK